MDSYICVLMVCFKSMHLFPRDEHLIYSLFTYFLETADFFFCGKSKGLMHDQEMEK